MIDRQELIALLRDPVVVSVLHELSDLDRSIKAQHHTLGKLHNQASPGTHKHDGKDSLLLATGGGGFNPNPIDDPANWSASLGFDYEFDASSSSLPSGWAWIRQGTASYLETFGAGVITNDGEGHPAWAFIGRTVNVSGLGGGGEFTLTAKIDVGGAPNLAGIFVRDSSSGKTIFLSLNGTVGKYSGWPTPQTANTFPDFGPTSGVTGLSQLRYAKIRRYLVSSSERFDFHVSPDGRAWQPVKLNFTTSWAGPLTVDRIGFGIDNEASSGSTPSNIAAVACSWMRLRA